MIGREREGRNINGVGGCVITILYENIHDASTTMDCSSAPVHPHSHSGQPSSMQGVCRMCCRSHFDRLFSHRAFLSQPPPSACFSFSILSRCGSFINPCGLSPMEGHGTGQPIGGRGIEVLSMSALFTLLASTTSTGQFYQPRASVILITHSTALFPLYSKLMEGGVRAAPRGIWGKRSYEKKRSG